MKLKLIKLTEKYKDALCEMIDEWREDQIKNNTDRSPGVISKNDPRNFDYYVGHLDLKVEMGRYVPGSAFFLLDEERDRLLGAVHIRHYLNEELRYSGGHIGDGIRPTERGNLSRQTMLLPWPIPIGLYLRLISGASCSINVV
jgi:predicted acetyltransferase